MSEDVAVLNPEELFQMKARPRMSFPVEDLKCGEPMVQPDRAMVKSVSQWGVLQALLIREDGTVIAGRRRWKAAKIAGRKTVPVLIFDGDIEDDAILSLVENTNRRENPQNELFHIEDLLKRKPAFSYDRIKEMTGMSGQKLSRLLAIKEGLIPLLRRAFNDGMITVKVAEACAKRPAGFQQKMLKVLGDDGVLSLATVKSAGKVAKTAAVTALPADLFGGVDSKTKPAQQRVKDLLNEALEVAGDNKKLAASIKKALEVV